MFQSLSSAPKACPAFAGARGCNPRYPCFPPVQSFPLAQATRINPPKCANHCHRPQKTVLPSRGRGGRRPPLSLFPNYSPTVPCFAAARSHTPGSPFGFSLCSNVPSDSLRSSSVHFRAALIVPVPREASGGVSRSLLLGSELKSPKHSKPPKPVFMFFMFYTAKLNTTRNKSHLFYPCKSV